MRVRTLPALVAAVAVTLAALPLERGSAQTVAPVPTIAAGYRAPAAEPSAPAIVGVSAGPFVGISLQDAVEMALLKNPDLAVSASNVRVARYQIMQAKAPFDVQLQLGPSSSYSVTASQSLFFSGPGQSGIYTCVNQFFGTKHPCTIPVPGNIVQNQYEFQGDFTGRTTGGATWSAGIVRTRTYNNTIVNTFNPLYESSLNLSLTQPLLRNLGMNAPKRQLELSIIGADVNAAQAFTDASTAIARVEDAYWDLVAAWRNVAIQEEALKEAVAQQRSNVRLARRGAAAAIDATESQTQVSSFQNDVIAALQNVATLQNQLKSLIVTDPKDQIWAANLVPSSPVQQLPNAEDFATVVGLAGQNRPEVRLAQDQRRKADVDRAYARNQELPQADVQATLESNGLAGVLAPVPSFEVTSCSNNPALVCPTPPPDSQGKMGKATANMWAFKYPTFNIALVVNFPFHDEFARGLSQAAKEEQQQAAIALQGIHERIEVEARNALQSYQSALIRLYAARQAREAAESVYASEVRQFANGASTSYLVLQRQVELAQARGTELQAQTDLNKSVVELQRVEGTILSVNGVNLQTLGSKALP